MKVVKRDDDEGAALDEMADDKGMLRDGGGGALDYEQYYPTLLPLLPPEQERAAMKAAGSAPATAVLEVRRPAKPGLTPCSALFPRTARVLLSASADSIDCGTRPLYT